MTDTPDPGLALDDLAAEVARQDQTHPAGYPATRDGVFHGIQTAVYELDVEAMGAWRTDRCHCGVPMCRHTTWAATRGEMLQAAAVVLRTIRSIDQANRMCPTCSSLGARPLFPTRCTDPWHDRPAPTSALIRAGVPTGPVPTGPAPTMDVPVSTFPW
jgi:hypothetical protein